MIETEKYGYYHATNEGGYISWADLAEESYRAAGMNVKVNRVTTAEHDTGDGSKCQYLDLAKL